MAVTLQQIAERVGVSKQAVSYALNGKPGQVSPATRQRVRATARAMGYQPNWRARSFARRRSQVIGLVYGRPADYVERSRMVSALVERLAELDHELLLIPATGPVEKWAHKLRDGRVDGCLVTHPMPQGLDTFIAEHRLPAVLFNLRSDLPVPQVRLDDTQGAHLVMDHLLGLGHRRIAYFCAPKVHGHHYSNHERRAIYLDRMAEAGLEADAVEAEYDDYADRYLAAAPEARPTAVMVYNDHDAVRLMRALWHRRVRVPDQLSITGFNDDPGATETIPALTTVASPTVDLACRGLDLLMNRIEQPGAAEPEPDVLSQTLVVRDSTAPYPAGSHHRT